MTFLLLPETAVPGVTTGKVSHSLALNKNNNKGRLENVIDAMHPFYGAVVDGVTDDSAAIKLVEADVASAADGPQHVTVVFGPGRWRFADTSPVGGAAFVLDGLSNVTVKFEPGAVLVMDNLVDGNGSGHGILVKGAGEHITLVNPRIEWVEDEDATRSFGDGVRLVGWPGDEEPAEGWNGSTGTLSHVRVENAHITRAPATGLIAMGCSDVTVINHEAHFTHADGLHFNACRRTMTIGCTGVHTGDDALAYVTYWHATDIWQNADFGPFNQPTLGAWNNTDSTWSGLVSNDSQADGLRYAGALRVHGSTLAIDGCVGSGIVCDAGVIGGLYSYQYLASKACSVDGGSVTNTSGFGVHCQVFNVTFEDDFAFSDFTGTAFRNLTMSGTGQAAVVVNGSSVLNSGCSGLTVEGINAHGADCVFRGVRGGTIRNITAAAGGSVFIYGSDVPDTSPLSGRFPNDMTIGDVTVRGGGSIVLQDLRGGRVGHLQAFNSLMGGVAVLRCIGLEPDDIKVEYAYRNNAGVAPVAALLIAPAHSFRPKHVTVVHDTNDGGAGFLAVAVGGGSEDDVSSEVVLSDVVFRSGFEDGASRITGQSGTYAPVNWGYDAQCFDGLTWNREAYYVASWPVTFFIPASPGGTPAANGSVWRNTTTGAMYVRESGAWVAK